MVQSPQSLDLNISESVWNYMKRQTSNRVQVYKGELVLF